MQFVQKIALAFQCSYYLKCGIIILVTKHKNVPVQFLHYHSLDVHKMDFDVLNYVVFIPASTKESGDQVPSWRFFSSSALLWYNSQYNNCNGGAPRSGARFVFKPHVCVFRGIYLNNYCSDLDEISRSCSSRSSEQNLQQNSDFFHHLKKRIGWIELILCNV